MKRSINVLGMLLAIQLVLAIFFVLTTSGVSGVAGGEPLLHFETKAVDKITITQPHKTPMVVERREQRWLLPALHDFPALPSKVDGFLSRLAGLRKQLPLSTTAAAIKRFKVSTTVYEHQVVLHAGDKILATLWLGDSAGLRQVYARANEEDTVYNLDFATYEVSSDPNQWADKMVLNLNTDEITTVTLPDVSLERIQESKPASKPEEKPSDPDRNNSGKWQVAGLAPGEELNTQAVETLINRLSNLSFDAVLGKENQAQYRQDAPLLNLSVNMRTGEPRTYVFSVPQAEPGKETEKSTAYILKSSISPYYFKLAEFMVKELLETKRDKLIKTAVPAVTPVNSEATDKTKE